MHVHKLSTALLALLGALISVSPSARAEARFSSGAALSEELAALPTGDQLIVERGDQPVRFAGRDIVLRDATVILGFASELAYVAVIDGEAQFGELRAGRGRMLLIPTFGQQVRVERFDARRLVAALSTQAGITDGATLSSLAALAKAQDRGVFFGRLARTNFNVATLGSSTAELDRRSRVGGTAVRAVRFASGEPGTDIELTIVQRFLAALAMGDVEAVAQILDPLPYGYGALDNGGNAARRRMAERLIAEHDWRAFNEKAPAKMGETSWVASGDGERVTIELRRTIDFAFVQSIRVGG